MPPSEHAERVAAEPDARALLQAALRAAFEYRIFELERCPPGLAVFAFMLLATLPVLAFYLAFQKHFVSGLTGVTTKG
ncbi:hypothetical protein [Streptomyces sp. NPDC057580]|uniref:hypothetical protein n=1 Tax=Streptomyces sp. NPDC057580 TaxID=3346173 RepID=UPI0036BD2746